MIIRNIHHYAYITTNVINGKQYVGDRTCECELEKDNYIGSGRPLFNNAKRKYGKENFKKEILEVFETRKEAFDAQAKYIIQYNTLSPNGYNLSPTGGLNVKGCLSEESKRNIGEANKIKRKGKKASPETLIKMSLSMLGKNVGKICPESQKQYLKNLYYGKTYEEIYGEEKSKEIKEKQRISHKNFKHTEESKQKMRESQTGKTVSKETRKKISKTLKGKKQKERTKEHKKHLSEALTGKHVSEESKLKNKNSHLGKKHSKKTKIKFKEKTKCKYRGYKSTKSVITRYHNENCPHKNKLME